MNIFDSEGSVRQDISEAVEAIFRYLEKYPIPPTHRLKSASIGPIEKKESLGFMAEGPATPSKVEEPEKRQ